MGIEKFSLLGHSLGGFLSASYALKYPENLNKGIPFHFIKSNIMCSSRYRSMGDKKRNRYNTNTGRYSLE
jgi:pimeloyl-ACP methyl ester carboxylesterase